MLAATALLGMIAVGCGSSASNPPEGTPADAGSEAFYDSGHPLGDTGTNDTGTNDAAQDSRGNDATRDSGLNDSGLNDTGIKDTGVNDATSDAQTSTLTASPSSIAFGQVIIDSTSSKSVTLTNTGAAPLTVSQATASANFSVDTSQLPFALAPGQNATISVAFAPKASGNLSGTATFTTDIAGSAKVTLTGTGLHAVDLSWNASTGPNVVGYNVYRSQISGGPYTKINTSLVPGTTYVDTTVQKCQTYYYVTTAVNSSGVESTYSNEVKIVVPCT